MYPEKDFVILEIDTKLLNNIKLYFDPTYFKSKIDFHKSKIKAYYTYDNISPYAINVFDDKIK